MSRATIYEALPTIIPMARAMNHNPNGERSGLKFATAWLSL